MFVSGKHILTQFGTRLQSAVMRGQILLESNYLIRFPSEVYTVGRGTHIKVEEHIVQYAHMKQALLKANDIMQKVVQSLIMQSRSFVVFYILAFLFL